MKKRLLALVLSLCFMMALMPTSVFALTDAEKIAIIESLMDTSWYNADATEYHIDTAAGLWGLCYYGMSQKYVSFEGKTIYLDADIDLHGSQPWLSMYTSLTNYAFKGTFDGQGHTIYNLTGEPLFGSIIGAAVKNVTLANANVSGSGAIASQTASTGVIDNCVVTGKVTATSSMGGITGLNAGTINNCIVMATVSTTNANAGGIANNNTGTISNSFAFNDLVTNTRDLSARGRIAAMGTGKFINNVAYNGMSAGNYGFGDITETNDRNGISKSLDEIYAAGYLNGINKDIIPDYLFKEIIPDDKYNRFGVFLDETSVGGTFTSTIGFNLGSEFLADKVNLVEIKVAYNKDCFTAKGEVLVENAIVRSVKYDETYGFATFVIGAANNGEISFDKYTNIAQLVLTPIDGTNPEYATVQLVSIAAYSMGALVDVIVVKDYDYYAMKYREQFDVNGDGKVDLADLSLALYYFGAKEGDDNWDEACYSDFNSDGVIDTVDIMMLVNFLYGE